jgi:hypothetical protein
MTAGFSRIDITPPLDRIEAYGLGYWYQRSVRFTGVRDPLYVRTLALDDGSHRRLIISVDSILDTYGFVPAATAQISAGLSVDPGSVFITCTHTHSSPLIDRNDTRKGAEYGAFVTERIVQSAVEASNNSAPARLSISKGQVLNALYNRRPVLRNGQIAELHKPVAAGDIADAGPVNDVMTLVKVHADGGRFLGGLCHFGIHGVAVQCSDLISSDCMGRAIQAVEHETDSVLLHLNGPCGDIDPTLMGSDDALEEMTRRLFDGIHQIMSVAETPLPGAAPSRMVAGRFLANRRSTRRPEELADVRAQLDSGSEGVESGNHHSGAGYQRFLLSEEAKVGAMPSQFEVPYQLLTLCGIVLAGIGGEVFTKSGLALQESAAGITLLPVGLTGGAAGYLPTREMYAQGGYETACAQWCPIAPGQTERLLAQIAGEIQKISKGVTT